MRMPSFQSKSASRRTSRSQAPSFLSLTDETHQQQDNTVTQLEQQRAVNSGLATIANQAAQTLVRAAADQTNAVGATDKASLLHEISHLQEEVAETKLKEQAILEKLSQKQDQSSSARFQELQSKTGFFGNVWIVPPFSFPFSIFPFSISWCIG